MQRRRRGWTSGWGVLTLALLSCSSGGQGSVGVVFVRDSETRGLVVREAPPGGPGERAGLQPGDQVLMIEGQYVRDLPAKEIRVRLRGDVGTSVRLTVVRDGGEVHHVVVKRGELGERHGPPPPREERISE